MQKINLNSDHVNTICLQALYKILPELAAQLTKTGSSLGPSSTQYSG